MSMLVDLKVAQLMCSRLCHDLIGPVSAVNAGVELIGEAPSGPDDLDEALGLIGNSARQLSKRLAFFRVAFGLGALAGGAMPLAEVRNLAAGLLSEGRVSLDWQVGSNPESRTSLPTVAAKLILNMILLGAGSLPRGGDLKIQAAEFPEGVGVAMTAAGPGARVKEDILAAMAPDGVTDGDLTAHNVHAHLAACLAKTLGVEIEISDETDDEVRLAILIPAG